MAGLHSASYVYRAGGYPPARIRSSKLLDFDGESAKIGMESCLITDISPSDTVGHIASYAIPNAAVHTGTERDDAAVNCNVAQSPSRKTVLSAAGQPRRMHIKYPPLLLVRAVN